MYATQDCLYQCFDDVSFILCQLEHYRLFFCAFLKFQYLSVTYSNYKLIVQSTPDN